MTIKKEMRVVVNIMKLEPITNFETRIKIKDHRIFLKIINQMVDFNHYTNIIRKKDSY